MCCQQPQQHRIFLKKKDDEHDMTRQADISAKNKRISVSVWAENIKQRERERK